MSKSYVLVNGVSCEFEPRKPLKSVPDVAATVDGVETKVLVIASKNFEDRRVWIGAGRALVPPTVDLAKIVVTTTAAATKYDREALRTRIEVRAKKAAAVANVAMEESAAAAE